MKRSWQVNIVRLFALGVVVGFCVVMVVPKQFLSAPKWRIHVKGVDGRPAANLPIVESWVDWTLDSNWHEERKTTDAQGLVVFEERSRRYAPIRRVWQTVTQFLRFGFHGSWGAYAVITADGQHLYADSALRQDERQSVLMLK